MILLQLLCVVFGFALFVLFDLYNDNRKENIKYQHKLVQETFKSHPIQELEGRLIEIQYIDGSKDIVTVTTSYEEIIHFLSMREDSMTIDLLYTYTGGDIHEWYDTYIVSQQRYVILDK